MRPRSPCPLDILRPCKQLANNMTFRIRFILTTSLAVLLTLTACRSPQPTAAEIHAQSVAELASIQFHEYTGPQQWKIAKSTFSRNVHGITVFPLHNSPATPYRIIGELIVVYHREHPWEQDFANACHQHGATFAILTKRENSARFHAASYLIGNHEIEQ